MTKLIRSFILSVIIVLALASCGTPTPTPDPSLLNLSSQSQAGPTIELSVRVDTSVPLNALNQRITFNYDIKNIGATPVPGPLNVSVTMAGLTGATVAPTCPDVNTIGNKDTALDGTGQEILTCTSTYTITQADLDKGPVTITTTATVNGNNSGPVLTTVPIVQPKALTLTMTANPPTYKQAGDKISFKYEIKNSGTVILGPAQFTVSGGTLGAIPVNCDIATKTLALGEIATCTFEYTITTADLATDTITNKAVASGGGAGPSPEASATIAKSSVVQPNPNPSNLTVGSTIQHKVVDGEWLWQIARCYGADPAKVVQANLQLSNPALISPGTMVTVPNIGSVGKIYFPLPCVGTHTVIAGDTWSSIALKYNADVAVLQMVNSSTLTVGTVLKVPLNSADGAVTVSKALTLTMTANPTTYKQAGDRIIFAYVIRNSGTGSLGPAQFTVSGGSLGAAPVNCDIATKTLLPGEMATCTFEYIITTADLATNTITNKAIASGGGAGPSPEASATITNAAKALTLTITANPTTYKQAGDKIIFAYVIRNSGTAILGPAQFTVSGGSLGAAPVNCDIATKTLLPGETATCTFEYTITTADLNSNTITNKAVASGGGAGPSPEASATITKQ